MTIPPRRMIVHLVHGTWGRGLMPVLREELGRPPRGTPPFWFEEGSPFRDSVSRSLEHLDVEFRIFLWSGSNSFQARSDAADDLRRHLTKELSDPSAAHAVIGHSHAGNVIHEALTRKGGVPGADALVGVLTLATPFLGIEAETDDGSKLLLHGMLPIVIGGYAVALVGVNAAAGHQDTAGWMLTSFVAYFLGLAGGGKSAAWRWCLSAVYWICALASLFFVFRGVSPWFQTRYADDSFIAMATALLAPGAAMLLGLANFALLFAAWKAGSAGPKARLCRDLVQALATTYACAVLMIGSLQLATEATPWGSMFTTFLAFWPYLGLMLAPIIGPVLPMLRHRSVAVWRAEADEQALTNLPCALHAMRLVSDEASLAIVASQLVRTTTASPAKLFAWARSWSHKVWSLIVVSAAVLGAYLGYVHVGMLAGLAEGWLRFFLGSLLGIGEVCFLLILVGLLALPAFLLFSTFTYALVGLAVGTEVFGLLPAARIVCEPLPRGQGKQLSLRLLWPSREERNLLPLRHSMYDLPSVQSQVADWIRAKHPKSAQVEPLTFSSHGSVS